MLVQRTRSVYWKNWAAKHGYEELKEGAWLEPGLALLRKKVKENWTEKSIAMWPGRSSWKGVGRKRDYLILAGRMLVNVKLARCRKAQRSTGFTCPEWHAVRREIPEAFRKWEQKSENLKEGVEVAKWHCPRTL